MDCNKCGQEIIGAYLEIASYYPEPHDEFDTIYKKYCKKCALQSFFINSQVGWHLKGEF